MNFQQLRVFHSAATRGGFTRAAEHLRLSQSTVSLHVKELEDELETPLFLRVGRGVMLSPEGKVLLQYAERIFSDLKNAEMAVREMSAVRRGTIRLGTGATTLMYRLPPILLAYQKRFPQIELLVETGTTEFLIQELSAQRLDLAIVMHPASQAGLRVTPLYREELAVVLHRNHPAARKTALTPADLASMKFILFVKNTVMQNLIDAWFQDLGVTPRIAMEMENVEAVKALVRAGLGASVLQVCALPPRAASELVALRVTGKPLWRQLGLATMDAATLPNSIRELSGMLCDGLRTARKRRRSIASANDTHEKNLLD